MGHVLFGRNWLEVFNLNWNNICTIHNQALKEILDSHEKVFEEGLGTLVGFEAEICGSTGKTQILQSKACTLCLL